jgi:hypothetical protein
MIHTFVISVHPKNFGVNLQFWQGGEAADPKFPAVSPTGNSRVFSAGTGKPCMHSYNTPKLCPQEKMHGRKRLSLLPLPLRSKYHGLLTIRHFLEGLNTGNRAEYNRRRFNNGGFQGGTCHKKICTGCNIIFLQLYL